MPAADPLYTVCDGHLCFDGVDLVELADTHETPFFVFSERRLRDNVEAVIGCLPAAPPAHRGVLRQQGLLQPVVPARGRATPAPTSRSTPAASWRRRCAAGFEPAADRLQRRRQDAGRDRARRRLRRARLHGRLGVRAGADRRGGGRRWTGSPPSRRASTCTCRRSRTPASRRRTAARRASTATTRRPRSAAPPPSTRIWSPPACTCTSARRSPAWSRTGRRSPPLSTSWPRWRPPPACACGSSTPAAASPCRIARRPSPATRATTSARC